MYSIWSAYVKDLEYDQAGVFYTLFSYIIFHLENLINIYFSKMSFLSYFYYYNSFFFTCFSVSQKREKTFPLNNYAEYSEPIDVSGEKNRRSPSLAHLKHLLDDEFINVTIINHV